RDDKFWYEDGSVVLIAGRVGFRVYRGLLADCSPVFRNMLPSTQLPQSTGTGGTTVLWACPEYHLSDSPAELRELLKVLIPRAEANLFESTHPTYETISACVRLGHKYQIEPLVKQSLAYLSRFYPSDFDALLQGGQCCPPRFTFSHAIGVVNLARLTGTSALLPTALALCCTLKAHQLVDGFQHADGARETLAPTDLALCIQAHRALVREHVALVFKVFAPERARGCIGGAACVEGMRRLLGEQAERVQSFTTPLPYAQWHVVSELHRSAVCPPCFLLLKKREEDLRRDIWNRLPALVGVVVEGW
ncbi:hypothetical protein C8Q76DRAFT_592250, partial [Earliella scabrosa]